jgi:DNA replication and repair protein RecF
MYLKDITLINYKNFSEAHFDFDHKINCFVGKNGIGKTNVLDAIFHMAYGKSYFNPLAVQNIKHNEEFYVIEGQFVLGDKEEQIVCSLKKGQKKTLKRNGKIYEKFSDHIGLIPLVIISPADQDLIMEGSEARRKFMDTVISQLDKNYLTQLIQYQKNIIQRNALLKYFALNHVFETDTLSVYNEQLSILGHQIFEKRTQFIKDFIPIFNKFYKEISNNEEEVQLEYQSSLKEKDLLSLLHENINKDRALQYTSVGVHKDDLNFLIQDFSIKKFGSQGQQKSFLIALKLAQFEFMKRQSGQNPILLFDDIFDKLDEYRVEKIVKMVNDNNFGQLFISDTHSERTESLVKTTHQSFKIFKL